MPPTVTAEKARFEYLINKLLDFANLRGDFNPNFNLIRVNCSYYVGSLNEETLDDSIEHYLLVEVTDQGPLMTKIEQ